MTTTRDDHDMRFALWVPRMLAATLALGGCFWGLLLSPWVFRPDVSPMAVLVLGPGYLVTLGYLVRTFSTPPPSVRDLIWVASFLVQGAWLAWDLWGLLSMIAAGETPHEPLLPTAWWLFATAVSLVGLFFETSNRIES